MRRRGGYSWDGYAARWAELHGGVDPRRSSVALRYWSRLAYGTGRALVALRVAPVAVTAAGLALSLTVMLPAAIGGTWLFAAAALVVLAAVADSADGAVAVLSRRTSRLGALQDAMADRIGEAAWLVGLWFAGAHVVLVTTCGALAWLHEYLRARAGACGLPGVVTLTVAERPTRVIAVTAAFVLAGVATLVEPRLANGAMTVVLALWALLGLLGLLKLHRAVGEALRVRPGSG